MSDAFGKGRSTITLRSNLADSLVAASPRPSASLALSTVHSNPELQIEACCRERLPACRYAVTPAESRSFGVTRALFLRPARRPLKPVRCPTFRTTSTAGCGRAGSPPPPAGPSLRHPLAGRCSSSRLRCWAAAPISAELWPVRAPRSPGKRYPMSRKTGAAMSSLTDTAEPFTKTSPWSCARHSFDPPRPDRLVFGGHCGTHRGRLHCIGAAAAHPRQVAGRVVFPRARRRALDPRTISTDGRAFATVTARRGAALNLDPDHFLRGDKT